MGRGDTGLAKSRADVVAIFAHCELFSSLHQSDCAALVARCEVRDLAPDSVLIIEGETGEEMYVLIEGVLEVFKDTGGDRVVLQRLDQPGDYTGEGALKRESGNIRRASVRTISPARVLAVPRAVFQDALALSPAVRAHLDAVYERHTRQLSMVEKSVMYRALVLFDQEDDWSRERHYEAGDAIFEEGESGDCVYLVRVGKVLITRIEDGEEIILAALGEGQTFGELAVLDGGVRKASARAETATDLLVVDRERFLQVSAKSPELHEYLGTLKKVYTMQDGVATVFDGEFRGGPAVVTVLKLDDGREAIVNHVVDREIYSASLELSDTAEVEEFSFQDERRNILRSLALHGGELVRVHAEGPWRELAEVHQMLISRVPADREALERFAETGRLIEVEEPPDGPDAVLCQCLRVTRAWVESALARGAATLEELAEETGATTICGACATRLAEMVSSTGLAVRFSEQVEVSPGVRSFRFRSEPPGESTGPATLRAALPGQHVVVSAEVDGAWVHRPYTITSPFDCIDWREITVKREAHGYFSNWLFEGPADPNLRLSHPKGNFWVDPDLPQTVVCLVAGIGMTPALAIARSLEKADEGLRVHVDYSARTEIDFGYREEFDRLAASHPNLSVHYRTTGGGHRLDATAVNEIAARFKGARFLVCGPDSYQDDVRGLLIAAGVGERRIEVERFTPVGHAPQAPAEKRGRADAWQLWATLGLSALYLLQAMLGWSPDWLSSLQSREGYAIATGLLLLVYVGYQWVLPYLRLRARLTQTGPHYRWHRHLGPAGPVLLYFHAASLGYAYTLVLPVLFVLNAMIGALDKTMIGDPERAFRYQRYWLAVHVPVSCLLTAGMLMHMIYALAYR